MTTKLWVRTYKNRPAILIRIEDGKVRFRSDDKEHLISKTAWENLPLWTGPSPFLNEGRQGFPPLGKDPVEGSDG
jgi:hypothetical protein